MSVRFDSITPLPSGVAAQRAAQRATERKQRQERNTAMRRDQLVGVALSLFEAVGNEGFNMRLMAQRAGYTAGALYAYFEGKDVILAALRLRVLEQLAAEVRSVRLSKGRAVLSPSFTGQQRSPSVTPTGDARDQAALARATYVARSLAWWRRLERDPHRLQLLLLRNRPTEMSDTPTQVAGEADPSALAQLRQATEPGLDALRGMGLADAAALQLNDEVLAYGLGLLVLQAAPSSQGGEGLETRFLHTLCRWMDRENNELAVPGDEPQDPQLERQGDLFSG